MLLGIIGVSPSRETRESSVSFFPLLGVSSFLFPSGPISPRWMEAPLFRSFAFVSFHASILIFPVLRYLRDVRQFSPSSNPLHPKNFLVPQGSRFCFVLSAISLRRTVRLPGTPCFTLPSSYFIISCFGSVFPVTCSPLLNFRPRQNFHAGLPPCSRLPKDSLVPSALFWAAARVHLAASPQCTRSPRSPHD